MKFANNAPRNIGMILLSVWLILTGLVQLAHLSFALLGPILGCLAIASGVLLIMNR